MGALGEISRRRQTHRAGGLETQSASGKRSLYSYGDWRRRLGDSSQLGSHQWYQSQPGPTYDPDALNFKAAKNDDFVEAAKEFITSQKQGLEYELKVVKNGKPTGETIKKKIDGCSTWTPADKMIFDELSGVTDIISTKEFNNQMPCGVLIMNDEWCKRKTPGSSNRNSESLFGSRQPNQTIRRMGQVCFRCCSQNFCVRNSESGIRCSKDILKPKMACLSMSVAHR